MSRIKGSNTAPEIAVRCILHRLGYRFRLHSKGLIGRPDIVLHKWKTVVLVHGCFWHRHCNCRFAYAPKTRKSYWLEKFSTNVERDKNVKRQLRKLGWRVLTVWECSLANPERVAIVLSNAIRREATSDKMSIRHDTPENVTYRKRRLSSS